MEMGPREEARGWPGLGQGVGAPLESLRPACRGGGSGLASPIVSWVLPPYLPFLYNLRVYLCVEGVPVRAWWQRTRGVGCAGLPAATFITEQL